MQNEPRTKAGQKLDFSKQALKFIKKQNKATQARFREAIEGYPKGAEKLEGYNLYKVRVGDFRIIFDDMGTILMVEIIDNRGEVYRRLKRGNY